MLKYIEDKDKSKIKLKKIEKIDVRNYRVLWSKEF